MTQTPQTPRNDSGAGPAEAAEATPGHRRPEQGGAPAGKDEAPPATGGEGAAGAGGPDGFGTGS